ncbi:hypothetical protein HYU14_01350 [Candidatus Woesearchaeota archaeon]|nr:hypothetical protein [Candidatus Woesearchaeota archaeon]
MKKTPQDDPYGIIELLRKNPSYEPKFHDFSELSGSKDEDLIFPTAPKSLVNDKSPIIIQHLLEKYPTPGPTVIDAKTLDKICLFGGLEFNDVFPEEARQALGQAFQDELPKYNSRAHLDDLSHLLEETEFKIPRFTLQAIDAYLLRNIWQPGNNPGEFTAETQAYSHGSQTGAIGSKTLSLRFEKDRAIFGIQSGGNALEYQIQLTAGSEQNAYGRWNVVNDGGLGDKKANEVFKAYMAFMLRSSLKGKPKIPPGNLDYKINPLDDLEWEMR